jgi:hypothetical protein
MEGERKALKRRVGQGHIKLNCIEVQRKNGRKKKAHGKQSIVFFYGAETLLLLSW